ncbi:hypothetical protein TNCV_4215451 [Trichonephila clavipes]|nr:hypothetical protein TNCV_4215451 [Trichonephila clavipes]
MLAMIRYLEDWATTALTGGLKFITRKTAYTSILSGLFQTLLAPGCSTQVPNGKTDTDHTLPKWTVGSLVVRELDSKPEGLGSMPDATKYPPSTRGVHAR